ncbi:hypothetical protein STENM327S_01943 [Streptomyces tendae]
MTPCPAPSAGGAASSSGTHCRVENQVSGAGSSSAAAGSLTRSANRPERRSATSAARWILPLAVLWNSPSVTGTSRSGAIPDSRTRIARACSFVAASASASQLTGTKKTTSWSVAAPGSRTPAAAEKVTRTPSTRSTTLSSSCAM